MANGEVSAMKAAKEHSAQSAAQAASNHQSVARVSQEMSRTNAANIKLQDFAKKPVGKK